jgi:hypothetical protein
VPEQNRGSIDCIDDCTNILDSSVKAILLRVAAFPNPTSMGNNDGVIFGEPGDYGLPILGGGATMKEE